jgi:hypothetical protein
VSDYIEPYDVTTPDGGEDRSLGDDRIREFKRSVKEILQTFFNWNHPNFLTWKAAVIPASAIASLAWAQITGRNVVADIGAGTLTEPLFAAGATGSVRALGFTPASYRGHFLVNVNTLYTGAAYEYYDLVVAGVDSGSLVFISATNTGTGNLPSWFRDGTNWFYPEPRAGVIRIHKRGTVGGGLDNGDRLIVNIMGS